MDSTNNECSTPLIHLHEGHALIPAPTFRNTRGRGEEGTQGGRNKKERKKTRRKGKKKKRPIDARVVCECVASIGRVVDDHPSHKQGRGRAGGARKFKFCCSFARPTYAGHRFSPPACKDDSRTKQRVSSLMNAHRGRRCRGRRGRIKKKGFKSYL